MCGANFGGLIEGKWDGTVSRISVVSALEKRESGDGTSQSELPGTVYGQC